MSGCMYLPLHGWYAHELWSQLSFCGDGIKTNCFKNRARVKTLLAREKTLLARKETPLPKLPYHKCLSSNVKSWEFLHNDMVADFIYSCPKSIWDLDVITPPQVSQWSFQSSIAPGGARLADEHQEQWLVMVYLKSQHQGIKVMVTASESRSWENNVKAQIDMVLWALNTKFCLHGGGQRRIHIICLVVCVDLWLHLH